VRVRRGLTPAGAADVLVPLGDRFRLRTDADAAITFCGIASR
jgi:hypothetical protein